MERRVLFTDFPVTNVLDSGEGSLRAAIEAANLSPGPDSISFNIGGGGPQTIAPLTGLPIVIDPLVIDGHTQPGFAGTPLITLDGISVVDSSGLRLSAGNSTIRGLRITRFSSNGLAIDTVGGNVIESNEVVGNLGDGVMILSSNNRVGGATPAQRNVISGNGDTGVDISGGGSNLIVGNYIGTDVSGTIAAPNASFGVRVSDAAGNVIGGTSAAERNLISGNASDGVRITGVSTNTFVRGNWIGLASTGAPLGNQENGVTTFSGNNTIGGDIAGAGNVISANGDHGVEISGASAGGNVVAGNFIGTNPAATAALGNGPVGGGSAGVRVNGASGNTIGGTSSIARNVISGNRSDGVRIENLGATANVVQGNFIGTNASGTAAIPNTNDGIQIRNGANTIGGAAAAAGNLISGNSDDGIDLRNAADGNLLQGNFIGTNLAGTSALGNGSDGIEIHGINTTIGGTTAAARNLIAGNGSDGIDIEADLTGAATGTVIQGNFIGAGAGAAVLGNSGHGVHIKSGGVTTVGGSFPAAANLIANNGLDGVFVLGSSANTVRFNSIESNGGLGIDLGADGVTPNDLGDADLGANDLQNFPVISSAIPGAGGTLVNLSLNSTPNATFTMDVYQVTAPDASGHGEGQTHVGTAIVSTDAGGNAATTINVGAVGAGLSVSATATNAGGSTSEFGPAVSVGSDTVAPVVNSSQFLFDGVTLPAPPHRLIYTFSENVSNSLGATDLLLENLTTGSTVPSASIAVGYDTASNTATFTFPGFTNGILPDGSYRATLLAAGVTDPAGNPLAANHVSTFLFLQGDANHDGRVNLADFNILASNFGQSNRTFSQGDFNYDGTVNLADFNLLASRFGTALEPDEGLNWQSDSAD